MRKRRKAEEHDNADRWVVSYADFITLLFAFFTTMYAISHVDVGKLERFAGSMRSAFKATGPGSADVIIEGISPISYEDIQLEKDIKAALGKFDKIGDVSVTREDRGISISFGDSVLFDPGSAKIKNGVAPLLSSVASIIKKVPNDIVIEGHTDNMPISNSEYHSNWELSTARATSVLMQVLKDTDIDPGRFSASGYGEFKPVATNSTPEGRAKNRRVEIIFIGRKKG